ncbi:MAG TPA: hypothetical protein VJM47_08070, partial [Nitrosospira sp.]|nr:hypothetical protein [Nitrosospira sp.]
MTLSLLFLPTGEGSNHQGEGGGALRAETPTSVFDGEVHSLGTPAALPVFHAEDDKQIGVPRFF